MNIKIDFQKMQQDALINKLKLNEYLYIIGKVKEYKASTEKQGAIDIVVSFKKTYILYYDMGIYCYKDKQLSERGEKFFIYFKRLIKENKEYEKLNEEAKEKLKEIIYVLSTMDELTEEDLIDMDKDLKKIAESKIEGKAIQKSFATKLFATLNPKMPVWDENVIQSLENMLSDESKIKIKELKRKSSNDKKIDSIIDVYKDIYKIENRMIKENKNAIDEFKNFCKNAKDELTDEKFIIENVNKEKEDYCSLIDKLSDNDITEAKIIDFFLWKKATTQNKQKEEIYK